MPITNYCGVRDTVTQQPETLPALSFEDLQSLGDQFQEYYYFMRQMPSNADFYRLIYQTSTRHLQQISTTWLTRDQFASTQVRECIQREFEDRLEILTSSTPSPLTPAVIPIEQWHAQETLVKEMLRRQTEINNSSRFVAAAYIAELHEWLHDTPLPALQECLTILIERCADHNLRGLVISVISARAPTGESIRNFNMAPQGAIRFVALPPNNLVFHHEIKCSNDNWVGIDLAVHTEYRKSKGEHFEVPLIMSPDRWYMPVITKVPLIPVSAKPTPPTRLQRVVFIGED